MFEELTEKLDKVFRDIREEYKRWAAQCTFGIVRG